MTERRQFVGHTSTAEAEQFTGLPREITVDQQMETLRLHDGNTKGGFPLMRADMSNVDFSLIQGQFDLFEKTANKVQDLGDENREFKDGVENLQYPSVAAVLKALRKKANVDLDNLSEAGLTFLKGIASERAINYVTTIYGMPESQTDTGWHTHFVIPRGKLMLVIGYAGPEVYTRTEGKSTGAINFGLTSHGFADTNYFIMGQGTKIANETSSGGHSGYLYGTLAGLSFNAYAKKTNSFRFTTMYYEDGSSNQMDCDRVAYLLFGKISDDTCKYIQNTYGIDFGL